MFADLCADLIQLIVDYCDDFTRTVCFFTSHQLHDYVQKLKHPLNFYHYQVIKDGNITLLQWLYSINNKLPSHSCEIATREGHKDIIIWLRNEGFDLLDSCAYAAGRGDLELLKWLREFGAAWAWTTPAQAARLGHLEIVKYSWFENCSWHSDVMIFAEAYARNTENYFIVDWLMETNCTSTTVVR
jgi:hypothetical protein